MGRLPDENILSVDDGVPFYPGLVAIAPSPLQKGLLYVGTDDGRLRMSVDDGKTWTDLQDRLPGAPKSSWFGGIEASRHNAGTVYVAMDNHRSNDLGNWIYKSSDAGKTFTAIVGDMPAGRVVRTIREDVKNPNLLFAGTEIGLFFSPNGGTNWIELKNNMPTLPFNDLVIHPRDNDLVLASHGRGIWILDRINALQELTPQVIGSAAHLFTAAPAYQIRQTNLKAHTGDMWFRGDNPANGALVDYWIGAPGVAPVITVHASSGQLVNTLRATGDRGVNRIVWNLRETDLPIRGGGGGDDDDAGAPRGGMPGPLVRAGHVCHSSGRRRPHDGAEGGGARGPAHRDRVGGTQAVDGCRSTSGGPRAGIWSGQRSDSEDAWCRRGCDRPQTPVARVDLANRWSVWSRRQVDRRADERSAESIGVLPDDGEDAHVKSAGRILRHEKDTKNTKARRTQQWSPCLRALRVVGQLRRST